MQVNKVANNHSSFTGFLNSKPLLKTLEFAADNGALFAAGTATILSTFIRPFAILSAPNSKKENKEYACAKSIASSVVGFGVMALISKPIVDAINYLQNKPQQYLLPATIKKYKGNYSSLANSKSFAFSSQVFKLASSFISLIPKAILTCTLIPPVMSLFFRDNVKNENIARHSTVSFAGKNILKKSNQSLSKILANSFATVFNNKKFQEFSQKYKNTNIAQHIFSAHDVFATALFAKYVKDSKKIPEQNKKTLISNAALMTGFSIAGAYILNHVLKKPTEMFIDKFKIANKSDKNLNKYIQGIKIAKPAILLGGLYYIIAPMVSTMFAENVANKFSGEQNE